MNKNIDKKFLHYEIDCLDNRKKVVVSCSQLNTKKTLLYANGYYLHYHDKTIQTKYYDLKEALTEIISNDYLIYEYYPIPKILIISINKIIILVSLLERISYNLPDNIIEKFISLNYVPKASSNILEDLSSTIQIKITELIYSKM